MLSASQINHHLRHHPTFMGCFPSNAIPPRLTTPCSMIVNTDPLAGDGDHWLGLVLTQHTAFYMDSFGCPLLEPDIIQYLVRYYDEVIYNKVCIQHPTSARCGYFCIAFVQQVRSLMDFYRFIQHFSPTQLKKNDTRVLKLL